MPALRSALLASLFFVAACDPAAPVVDGGTDAGLDGAADPDGGDLDAGSDAPSAPVDAPRTDTPRLDTPLDAGPDVSAEVEAALDFVCGVQAYADCTAPWGCGCETFSPPPDVASCTSRTRESCAFEVRPGLTSYFQRVGITLDREALDRCVAAARHSFDLCLAEPATDIDPVASCFDALVVGVPIGGACEFSGMGCADGAGVCSRSCVARPSTAGERCSVSCGGGLACVDGNCADPVAEGGACTDNEDCAADELCVGGRCGDPAGAGETCASDDECGTGYECAGVCTAAAASCRVDSPSCGAGRDCRTGSRRVCLARVGLGERCDDDFACQDRLFCDFGVFPSQCAPLPTLGEACDRSCTDGAVCVFDRFGSGGLCVEHRRLGEDCSSGTWSGEPLCESGLTCNMGLCGGAPRLGEPCSDDGRCEIGLACEWDPFSGGQFCQPARPEGSPCDRGGCDVGLFCDWTTGSPVCRRFPGEGEECPSGACQEGLECRFFAPLSRSICVPPAHLGEECSSICSAEAYCGDDLGGGTCTPLVCDLVSGGGIGPPIPF